MLSTRRISLWLLMFALLIPALAQAQARTAGDGLQLDIQEDGRTLVGVYHYQGKSLHFQARSTGDTSGVAKLWTADGDVVLRSIVKDPQNGFVKLGDQRLDGRGTVAAEAAGSLAALDAEHWGVHVALLNLELACRLQQAASLPAYAALVQPWQLSVKYTGAVAQSEALLERSGCKAANSLLLVDEGAPVPRVYGFLTLDADGAHPSTLFAPEPSAIGLQEWGATTGPCNTKCRGACGPNCDPDACDAITACVGGKTTQRCGSHKGCRDHDDCYDLGKTLFGCGFSWERLIWDRACDAVCLDTHGVTKCASWALGFGPFDRNLTFTNAPCS